MRNLNLNDYEEKKFYWGVCFISGFFLLFMTLFTITTIYSRAAFKRDGKEMAGLIISKHKVARSGYVYKIRTSLHYDPRTCELHHNKSFGDPGDTVRIMLPPYCNVMLASDFKNPSHD